MFLAQLQGVQVHHIQHQQRRARGDSSWNRWRGAAAEMTRGERGAQVNDTWEAETGEVCWYPKYGVIWKMMWVCGNLPYFS